MDVEHGDAEAYEAKYKELEAVFQPVMAKMAQNGEAAQDADASAQDAPTAEADVDEGPKIEEID